MTIEPDTISKLRGVPLTADDWSAKLADHQRFVGGSTPSGRWQVLEVAGLPLAVWMGSGSGAGKQLNLNLGNLSGLQLAGAQLEAAAMPGVFAEQVSFRDANLRLALVTDAKFDGADFSNTRLDGADFSRSSLRGVSFRGASGDETDFENCDLEGADFTGSSFTNPKLSGANLNGVIGLAR